MAEYLGLTADQRSRVGAVEEKMSNVAIPLGRAIVHAEPNLNDRFANGTIDDAALEAMTARIGELQGRLRAVLSGSVARLC